MSNKGSSRFTDFSLLCACSKSSLTNLVLVSTYCVHKSIQNRNGHGQRSWFLQLTKRSAASRDENVLSLQSWNDITIIPSILFWSCGFVPHRKWNLTLLVHQNMGKENCYRKFFFAIPISTLRRFNQANKRICHTHFKWDCIMVEHRGCTSILLLRIRPRLSLFTALC